MMLFAVMLQFCCALIAVSVGVIVLMAKNLRPVNFWLAMTSIFSGLWTLGVALFISQSDLNVAEVIARSYYVVALTIGLSLYFFSRYYPHKKSSSPVEQLAIVLIYAIGIAYAAIPGWMVINVEKGVGYFELPINVANLNNLFYAYYSAVFLTIVAKALINLAISMREAKYKKQIQLSTQIKGIIFCVSAALLGGSFFNLILPFLGNYSMIWIGPLFSAIFTVYIFYILAKQGLFDVRAAVTRSIGYIVMVAVIAFVYATLLFLLGGMFVVNPIIETWQLAVYVVLSVILAFTVRPMQRLLDKLTYSIFYRSDYQLEETLREFSSMTANEIELGKLVRKSLGILSKAMRPEYVSLYVLAADGKTYHYAKNLATGGSPRRYRQQLDIVQDALKDMPRLLRINDAQNIDFHEVIKETGASIIVQLVVRDEHVGVLFIGKRENEVPYGDKDMQLLSTACDELALAIQNGLRFEEIRQFNKRLRTEVDDATKELRLSNRQLHRIDEVKDEFLSIASHQLRTPLTSVKGYLSMVLDGDAGTITPTQRHLLQEAFTSSQRMVSLIEDFLNMSRLQTGRFVVDKKLNDIHELVTNEVDMLRPTAKTRDLALRLDAKDVPINVMIDESKIRQVIMNFIDNSIYYSKNKSTIRVSLATEAGEMVFKVKDAGIGVPIHEQARLFSKFYRASNARKRRPDGTGVGLYLAKKVIMAHGGSIIFESVEGEGSTFGFKLPLPKQVD